MGEVTQLIKTKEPYLKMDYHFFPKVQIEMCLEKPEEADLEFFVDLDWNFKVSVDQDENRDEAYAVRMELATDNEEQKAYQVKLEAIGLFHFTDAFPDPEEREHMIYVLGQNLLYGACREYLFTMTAHGPHPAIYLPSITFVPDKKVEEEEVEALEE